MLRAKPHAERQLVRVLESRRINVFLPLVNRRRGSEPLFSGYMFLNIDRHSDEYLRSRSAPGVSYVLCADGEPIPVDDELVEAIRQRVEAENRLDPAERFRHGSHVVVTKGPFRDIEAIFDRSLSGRGRCLVMLEVLGRLTRVQFDADSLAEARQ